MFRQYSSGPQAHVLDLHSPMPTALHSWGNQCYPCPCGCRQDFSHARLQSKGLHGALVLQEAKGDASTFRHVSPIEAAIANGLPIIGNSSRNQRLALAGIGQLASPLQSCWIFAHIRSHLQAAQCGFEQAILPRAFLHQLCSDLFSLRDRLFRDQTPGMKLFQERIQNALNPLPKQEHTRVTNTFRAEPYVANWKCINPVSPLRSKATAEESRSSSFHATAENPDISPTVPFTIAEDEQGGKRIVPAPSGAAPGFASAPTRVPPFVPADQSVAEGIDANMLDVDAGEGETENLTEAEPPVHIEVPVPATDERPNDEIAIVPAPPGPGLAIDPLAERATEAAPTIPWWINRCACLAGENLDLPHILIVRLASCNVQVIRFKEGMTLADLMQAETKLHSPDACAFVYDLLCMHVSEEDPLESGQAFVLSPTPFRSVQVSQLVELQQLMCNVPRAIATCFQGPYVAYDELSFYMQAVASTMQAEFVPAVVLGNPDTQQAVSEAWAHEVIAFLDQQKPVCSVILINHHWIPLVWIPQVGQWIVKAPAFGLAVWQALACSMSNVEPRIAQVRYETIEMPTTFPNNCGFQAVWWINSILREERTVMPVDVQMANEMRQNFLVSTLSANPPATTAADVLLGGTNSPELLAAIASMLQEHGVPTDCSNTRATKVVDVLGPKQVDQILRTPRPWSALKHAANQVKPPMQLVMPHELQGVIESRAKDAKPIGTKKRKQVKEQIESPVPMPRLTSAEVIGVFRQADGIALPQIRVSDMSPSTRGIVVGTEKELQAYIPKPCISSEGLALIILEPSETLIAEHGKPLRFPISCALTQEPMLISAVMIQKGKLKVERNLPEQRVQVSEQENQVFKLLLFRDECADWQAVVKAPVRSVLDLLPSLQSCTASNCACPRRHVQASADAEDVLLDVWNKDFLSLKFAKVSPAHAEMYVCTIRVAQEYASLVFKASGGNGLFVEPRAVDGSKATSEYHTIWLPKRRLEEVRAEQAAIQAFTFIVRINMKYGLCTTIGKAEDVHRALKGNQPFLSGPVKQIWHVGPLPWGSTRKSVNALLEAWNWTGKPLQPSGRAADGSGLMWSVQSGGPPPHTVYSLAHGDVVITRADKPIAMPPLMTGRLEASKHTRDQLGRAGEQVDPLMHNDPWANANDAKSKQPREIPVATGVTHAHLATLEATMNAKLAQLQKNAEPSDVNMESQWESRVTTLETQVQQLTAAHQAHSQQTSIMSNQVAQLAAKLDQQSHVIEQKLDSKMSEQMQKIEALLCKRARGE